MKRPHSHGTDGHSNVNPDAELFVKTILPLSGFELATSKSSGKLLLLAAHYGVFESLLQLYGVYQKRSAIIKPRYSELKLGGSLILFGENLPN